MLIASRQSIVAVQQILVFDGITGLVDASKTFDDDLRVIFLLKVESNFHIFMDIVNFDFIYGTRFGFAAKDIVVTIVPTKGFVGR